MDALTNHYIDIRIDGRVFDRLPANPDAQHRRHHTSGGTSGYTHCHTHSYTRHRRHSIGQDGGHYDRLSCCHSDGNPDIDPNLNADPVAHSNTDPNAHGHTSAHPNTSAHAYLHTPPDCYAHAHTTTRPNASPHTYPRERTVFVGPNRPCRDACGGADRHS